MPMSRSSAVSLLFSPQYDVHRLQPGCDVSFCDFWRVGFEHVRLRGFHVGHRRSQPLPQAQEIVNAVWCKLPVLPGAERDRRGKKTSLDYFTRIILTHAALDMATYKGFNDPVANFNNEFQFTPEFSGHYQQSVKTER